METTIQLSPTDKLRDLAHKPLFWFLKGGDLEKIQHDIKTENFPFGQVYIETLGSGATGKINEDAPLVLDMGKGRVLLSVLDAASSQKKISSLDNEGVSGAFYVSHLTSMGFGGSSEYKDLCARVELEAKDVATVINEWIYEKMRNVHGVDYTDIPTVPGMAAVMLLVDQTNKRLSIAQIADTGAALLKSDGTLEVITPNLNERFDRETMDYIHELVERFGSDLSHIRQIPEAKELIRKQLADSFTRKTNKKGGVGILNGMSELEANHLIYSYNIPLDERVSSVLLYSDGAILPYMGKDVSIHDAAEALAKSVYGKTLISPLIQGQAILEADSNFTEIPRMKIKDDATVIAVRFR